MTQGRLTGLDGLRGIAALCVLLFHLPLVYPGPSPLEKAYLGVDFFFMLSGYVLTRTYHARFGSGLTPIGFMAKRLKRLWPVVALGMVFGFLQQYGSDPSAQGMLLLAAGLFLVPRLSGGPIFPLNGAFWSIFFELFANLVHAAVLWRLRLTLLVILAGVLLAGLALIAVDKGNLDVGSWTHAFESGFIRVGFSYVTGVILSLWWKDQPPLRLPWFFTIAAMPVAFFAAKSLGFLGWQFDLFFVTILCPLLIAGGLRETGPLLEPIARAFGRLSYPLYGIHLPILYAAGSLGFGWFGAIVATIAGAAIAEFLTTTVTKRRATTVREQTSAT